jgi:hypothetical protein
MVDGDAYPNLMREKGGMGFPYLAILDADGNLLAPHRGPHTVAAFRATVASAQLVRQRLVYLQKQVSGGDDEAGRELLALQLQLGHLDPPTAWARLATLHLALTDLAEFTGLIAKTEVGLLLGDVSNDLASQVTAGKKTAAMLALGHIPVESRELYYFWGLTSRYADSRGDRQLLDQCLAGVKRMGKPDPVLLQSIEVAIATLTKAGAGK